MKNFGQYSIVSYMHELRGEKINLGVLVWHPVLGYDFRLPKSFQRIRCVDENADLTRVHEAAKRIQDIIEHWSDKTTSPLEQLAAEYKHGLVVSSPMNARIQDPAFTLERLYTSLVPPEPFARASSTVQFATTFASQIAEVLKEYGVLKVEKNYTETDTFQPVKITASYEYLQSHYVWRVFSFASIDNSEAQLTMAKAIYADNEDLRHLQKYQDAHLRLAVQLPKPMVRQDWQKSYAWLSRGAEKVEIFEDKASIASILPSLITAA